LAEHSSGIELGEPFIALAWRLVNGHPEAAEAALIDASRDVAARRAVD